MFKERIYKKAIRSYLGDYLLKQIDRDPRSFLQPFCWPVELVLLFQKVAGFGAVREDPDPENFFHVQNYYLSAITEIVQQHGGIVIDYLGDGVLSAWGLEQTAHPPRAARAALACAKIPAPAAPDDLILQGALHTGVCVAGNIGSGDKLKFTILGRPVNFVATLVEYNRKIGTRLLASDDIHFALPAEGFSLQEIDSTRAAGLEESKRFFEVKDET